MNKFLLLDVDGVVIPKDSYFSKRYAKDFSVPVERLMPFFKNEFRECQLGIKDLREVLEKYLTDWRWKGSIDELLQYWFEDRSVPDAEIMAVVRKARGTGMHCYLATDQEKYRAAYLWNDLGLNKEFDGSFFSCDLGARKYESLYWEKVLIVLGNPDPADASFWDDEAENIAAAQKVGISAYLFTNIENLKRELKIALNIF